MTLKTIHLEQVGRLSGARAEGGGVGGQVQVDGPLDDAGAQVEHHQTAGNVLAHVDALGQLLRMRLFHRAFDSVCEFFQIFGSEKQTEAGCVCRRPHCIATLFSNKYIIK